MMGRAGTRAAISIDEQEAETRYGQLPKAEPSPDRIYDQAWAKTLVRQVFEKLEQEYSDKDHAQIYYLLATWATAPLTTREK